MPSRSRMPVLPALEVRTWMPTSSRCWTHSLQQPQLGSFQTSALSSDAVAALAPSMDDRNRPANQTRYLRVRFIMFGSVTRSYRYRGFMALDCGSKPEM